MTTDNDEIDIDQHATEKASLYGAGVDAMVELLRHVRQNDYLLFTGEDIDVEQVPYRVTSKRFHDDGVLGNEEVAVFLQHPDKSMFAVMAHTYGEPSEDREWTEIVAYHRPDGPGSDFKRAGKISKIVVLDDEQAAETYEAYDVKEVEGASA